MTNPPAIEFQNVSFSYRNQSTLSNINLSIAAGEFVGIFGPNGGGKTTFLKLLMGFIQPNQGSIRVFQTPPEQVRHRIGYVPQVHRIDPDFPITVAELIVMGRMSKRPFYRPLSQSDWEAGENWMEQLGLLPHQDKAYSELSGGLAQRALLARALISDPDLILLDEPTSNIDAASMKIFLRTLERIKGTKTILLVTHDLKTIVHHATKLFCMQNQISMLEPREICNHFNFGLYHEPLANQLDPL